MSSHIDSDQWTNYFYLKKIMTYYNRAFLQWLLHDVTDDDSCHSCHLQHNIKMTVYL